MHAQTAALLSAVLTAGSLGIWQESGKAGQIIPPHRVWLYMAYMHSEALQDQQVRSLNFLMQLNFQRMLLTFLFWLDWKQN